MHALGCEPGLWWDPGYLHCTHVRVADEAQLAARGCVWRRVAGGAPVTALALPSVRLSPAGGPLTPGGELQLGLCPKLDGVLCSEPAGARCSGQACPASCPRLQLGPEAWHWSVLCLAVSGSVGVSGLPWRLHAGDITTHVCALSLLFSSLSPFREAGKPSSLSRCFQP